MNDPAYRNINFDQLVNAYRQSRRALIEGGVDLIMVETLFDTLNAKVAVFALEMEFEALGITLPVMISAPLPMPPGVRFPGRPPKRFTTRCVTCGRCRLVCTVR